MVAIAILSCQNTVTVSTLLLLPSKLTVQYKKLNPTFVVKNCSYDGPLFLSAFYLPFLSSHNTLFLHYKKNMWRNSIEGRDCCVSPVYYRQKCVKTRCHRVGEVAQWVRVLTALLEDQGSNLSHTWFLRTQWSKSPVPGVFWHPWSLHSHGIQAYIQINTHTPKINLNCFEKE